MARNRTRRPWLERLPGRRPEADFQWRGKEVSRLEGFADGVFAFAVTLLVVALEVPRTVDGLVEVIRGFPAFTVCFALLMIFWNAHYRFFRRYGLEDRLTRFLNTGVLLLVMFSVYPLKFLFGAILTFGSTQVPHISTWSELRFVYTVYGLGFLGIWLLYLLLHVHAMRQRHRLQLNEAEVLKTREQIVSFAINSVVSASSVILAQLNLSSSLPAYVYLLLMPALVLNALMHRRWVRAVVATGSPQRA